jgi:hypothetical protein
LNDVVVGRGARGTREMTNEAMLAPGIGNALFHAAFLARPRFRSGPPRSQCAG